MGMRFLLFLSLPRETARSVIALLSSARHASGSPFPLHPRNSEQMMESPSISISLFLIFTLFSSPLCFSEQTQEDPKPTPWPHQFHSILFMNYSGSLQMIDLWYDWPNGRNFNIIRTQLGNLLYDLEWNNGTSFFYTLDSDKECRSSQVEVGILRPNWLDGANYLGQRHVDGFLCNVWEKADFIWYYEDVVTKRPVHWVFYTGREAHVMTFEVGAALEDAKWQAPVYCFENQEQDDGDAIIEQPNTATSEERLLNGLQRGSMPF